MVCDVIMFVTLMTSWGVLLAAIFPQGGVSLKMVRMSVPQYILKGESLELLCEFDLQGDRLYSVSWYKDHDEFYRFVPRGSPSQHIYKIDGIKVDRLSSDSQRVVIRSVPLKASGMYRCEVSTEAPSFSSVHGESRMNVVALPKDGPAIVGEEQNYRLGDEINLNCTSAKSFPPARLRWYVNDVAVDSEFEVEVQQHGLMTSVAGLRFQVKSKHFHRGHLQVRCVATISTSPIVPTAPAQVQHHRLSATSLPSALEYNKEAFFSVRGGSTGVWASVTLLAVTSLLLIHL